MDLNVENIERRLKSFLGRLQVESIVLILYVSLSGIVFDAGFVVFVNNVYLFNMI